MANLERALLKCLRSIEPTGTQKEGAQRSHNHLREILCTGNFANKIKTSYLSGSYSRDTAIAPLDDVDIIFIIYANAWPNRFLSSLPSPINILESFARAVRYRYPESSVRIQSHSICLQMYHLNIDLVPAIDFDGNNLTILVPDARDEEWIRSSPKLHANMATDLNRRRHGLFKPLVKLLKLWNSNLPRTAYFKSFAIETLAVRLFSSISIQNLQDGLALFFDFIAWHDGRALLYHWRDRYGISLNRWSIEAPDIAGTGSNVLGSVDWERRQKFVDHACRARDRLMEAKATLKIDIAYLKLSEALRFSVK